MALTYIGGLAFGSGFPLPFAVAGRAALSAQGTVDALAAFKATPGLSMAGKIQFVTNMLANLQASAALGIEPPSLTLQLQLVLDVLAAVQADLDLYLSLANLGGLAAAFYAWNGPANAAGGALTTAWASGIPGGGGGAEVIDAAIVATNAGPVAAGLAQIIKMVL